jgi:small subunit ribosomal protein S16
VQEHTASPKGKFLESLGFYRPATNPKEFKVNMDRVKYFISKGAKPSPSLATLLKKNGMEGMDKYFTAPNKKRKKKGEEAEAKAAAPAAPAAPKAEKPAEPEAPAPAAEAPAAEPAPEAAPEQENQQAAPSGEPAK